MAKIAKTPEVKPPVKVKASKAPNVNIAEEVAAAARALAPAVNKLRKALERLDPAKLPVGTVADLLYDLRITKAQVPNLNAPFDDVLSPVVKALEEHFINTLSVGESSGVQGMAARVQITDSAVPTVEDWTKFYAHIKKTGSFELLNRAVNRAAVTERWDAKRQVPGVAAMRIKKVSCTKLSGKGR